MSALFLKDLAQKTHRGLEGRVRAGRSGGGLSFGYRVRRQIGPDGLPAAGEMEIVAEQAAIVRRIFGDYADGRSPRSIAVGLNAEGVPGPRSGKWSASLILGNADREIGILRNRLYAGVRVWNRQHFIKDPTTGRRVARPNPREAWVVNPVSHLQIIDADLWQAAQVRLTAGRRKVITAPRRARLAPACRIRRQSAAGLSLCAGRAGCCQAWCAAGSATAQWAWCQATAASGAPTAVSVARAPTSERCCASGCSSAS